jgi:hypothetical protein
MLGFSALNSNLEILMLKLGFLHILVFYGFMILVGIEYLSCTELMLLWCYS